MQQKTIDFFVNKLYSAKIFDQGAVNLPYIPPQDRVHPPPVAFAKQVEMVEQVIKIIEVSTCLISLFECPGFVVGPIESC